MNKCYWLLNHPPVQAQIDDLKANYNVVEILFPPKDVEGRWGSVPTTKEIEREFFIPFEEWFSTIDKEDVAVIQGEPTASYALITTLIERGIKVLAGITERKSCETTVDGRVIKTSTFEHVCFREYKK